MFKSLKNRTAAALKNRRGFTLVELIVVIVIVLIMAAVLVPTVMNYVDEAAKVSVKQDASTALTQLQTDVAWDSAVAIDNSVGTATGALKGSGYSIAGVTSTSLVTSINGSNSANGKTVTYVIGEHNNGNNIVTDFCFATESHYVTWNISSGWSEVK